MTSNYHVLIGAPNRDVAGMLVNQFQELPDWEVAGVHGTHQDVMSAIPRISGLEVVMLHEDMGPIPVMDQVRDIANRFPQLAILLVAREVTQELIARATEAGARGVLPEDVSLDELEVRATNVAEWSRALLKMLSNRQLDIPNQKRRGTIITFTGAKGGVGTTTIAAHVALRVARTSHTTCLVDLDLVTGDITGLFDLNHRHSITDLAEAAGEEISAGMLNETLYVHANGPHMLLAPEHGERGEDVTADTTRKILGALQSRYDIVIIDCGAVMNEATAMAVELADTSVVVVAPDLASLRGGQRLLEMWERLAIRKKKDVLSLIVRQHKKNEIQPEFARKLMGTPFLETTVPANYRAMEIAANTGDPDRVTDTDMRKAFTRVAEELGLLTPPPDPAATAKSKPPDEEPDDAVDAFVNARQGRASHGDRGASILEFVAVIPLLGFALLLGWQVILFGLTSMYASHAANEAARQAAVTPNNMELIHEEAAKRVRDPWDGEAFSLSIQTSGGRDYAEVGITMPWVIPVGNRDDMVVTAQSPIIPE